MYQECLSRQASGLSAHNYCQWVVLRLKLRVSTTTAPEQWKNISLGAALALGGTQISAAHCHALIASILNSYKTYDDHQMACMFLGICNYLFHSLGRTKITSTNCGVLVAYIRKSERMPEIISVIKKWRSGPALIHFLQLDKDGV